MKNILIISNGYGEDLIASKIIKAFLKISKKKIYIKALPLVGEGLYYDKIGIEKIHENKMFSSGGFVRSWITLLKDLKQGLLTNIFKQIKIIKNQNKNIDTVLVVGDVFALIMSSFLKKRPRYFLPTAKSNTFMKHWFLEKIIIKKLADYTFTRDEITAKDLQKTNPKVIYLGNPMMDDIPVSKIDYKFNHKKIICGLLPGSRKESLKNLSYMLKIAQNASDIEFIIAKADTISYDEISKLSINWKLKKKKYYYLEHKLSKRKIIISEYLGDVIINSNIILGQAGTANEQAVFYGKKVIAYTGFGTQSTQKRFDEQQKLVGKNLIFLKNKTMKNILKEIKKQAEMNNQKKILLHNQASEKIVKFILKLNF